MWWLGLAVVAGYWGQALGQCGGGVQAVVTFSCGAMPAPQCQQVLMPTSFVIYQEGS